MKRIALLLGALALTLSSVSCSSTSDPTKMTAVPGSGPGPKDKHGMSGAIPRSGQMRVRTTAYTHTEADSLPYGKKTAGGGQLRYSSVRSAAADWSRYPYGTVFRIEGQPGTYQIDDYGSALVGTNTIDLYKPSKAAMRSWGVRHVNIQVVKWGSYEKSLAIMKARVRAGHVRKMVSTITKRAGGRS